MIYLVRHGESDWNAAGIRHGCDDRRLTPLGAAQAWQAGLDLQTLTRAPIVIVTSPLQRAWHTAAILAFALGQYGVQPIVVRALIERAHDGEWLETTESAGERAAQAIGQYERTYAGATIIAVTHAGVIKGLLGISTPPNGSIHEWEPS